jgi:two-component system, chemotaxis family, chemotaxis protein CheY
MAYNVLIVDDSVTIRAIIAKTLQLAGIPTSELSEASNGREALEVLQNKWVDLVFLDINMPVMNGVELVEHMKADVMMSAVPVIVVSTEGSQTRIDQLSSKGVRAYLRKPFSPEALKQVVEQVLEVSNAS